MQQTTSPLILALKVKNPQTKQTKNNRSDMVSQNKERLESNNLQNDA